MSRLDEILHVPPFSLAKNEKRDLFLEELKQLTNHHYNYCREYKKIINTIDASKINANSISDLPFLPIQLFKLYDLLSTEKINIVKTITSSGTKGTGVSRIFLDKQTALNQTKTLIRIMSNLIGNNRLPLLIIDSESTVANRRELSARAAGILGFSIFSSDTTFALNESMQLDYDLVAQFGLKHQGKTILIFGFTYIIWQHFHEELTQLNKHLDLNHGILLHGGGWKNMEELSIDNSTFKKNTKTLTGISKVHNYYGMAEQTGSIFLECENGYLHSSNFSDIIVRRPDFSECEFMESGLIQVNSILPSSYPGHMILTEDRGEILGEDDCSCGRLGKYFRVLGRAESSEIRGCSDTYEQ